MATHEMTGNRSGGSRMESPNRPTIAEQTSKVAEDVRELGNIALAGAGEALQSVKERGSEALERAKEKGHDLLEKGRERVNRTRDGFEDYVAEHPFKSVLIAAGVGALIGYSLSLRHRRE